MSEFMKVLHDRIETTQQALEAAERAGLEREIHQHSARLLDLMDRADRHGIDARPWVRPAVLSTATRDCA